MCFKKPTQITKVDTLKLNNKTKYQALHLKFMLRKELEMQDMQVEKHQSLLVVV